MGGVRSRLGLAPALALVLAGCALGAPGETEGGARATSAPASSAAEVDLPFPRCEDIPWVSAAPEHYRDAPIYVANEQPDQQILGWAQQKPGFQEMWVDREHLGWLTLAFTEGADLRQRELVEEFPDVGVVAVAVEHSLDELLALQQRIGDQLGPLFGPSTWTSVQQQVVGIGVGVLSEDRLSDIEGRFAGEPICLDGIDPALAPAPGPQPASGDGWRLLADEIDAGAPYRTGIATDADSLAMLWAEAGITSPIPDVDFEREVAIWFGAVYGSSCPNLRLDDVVVDRDRALLYAKIVLVDPPMACTGDARPHAYLVAVERSRLPTGSFAIQLRAEDPPPGATEERTIVEVDISGPGAIAGPGDIHIAPPAPERYTIESGGIVEPGYPAWFRFDGRCGPAWLGEVNAVWWKTDPAEMPPAWSSHVGSGDVLELEILLELEPEPVITATANGESVEYRPSPEAPRDCS